MKGHEFLTYYPSRVLHVGAGVLACCILLSGLFLLFIVAQPNFPVPRRVGKSEEPLSLSVLLPWALQPRPFLFDAASLEEQFLLSLCPGRPDANAGPMAYVKIKGSNQAKQMALPAKLGLMFNPQGELCFGEAADQFWLELAVKDDGALAAALFLEEGGFLRNVSLRKQGAFPLLQKLEELPQEDAFQALGKARWLGVDLVYRIATGEVVQKVEIGSALLDIEEGGRIYWDGVRWAKAFLPAEGNGAPLAKVRGSVGQGLELDVWDRLGERYFRIAVPALAAPPARVKVEEWFSSIRIRSDKQISCLLEKQCLVLRENDWILKENGRWRVLRKLEEKQQVVQGKRVGDLIIVELIDAKRRAVQGRLIQANRIYGFPLELTVASKPEKKLAGRAA